MTESMIYWVTRFDKLVNVCDGMCFIAGTSAVIAFLVFIIATAVAASTYEQGISEDEQDEDYCISYRIGRAALRTFLVTFTMTIITTLATVFVPSTKEYCAMKIVPAIVNSDTTKQFSEEVIQLGREWIEELRPKSDKSASEKPHE